MDEKSPEEQALTEIVPTAAEEMALLIPTQEFRRGAPCPNCGDGILDYDGMLNLSCPVCGFSLSGCFT